MDTCLSAHIGWEAMGRGQEACFPYWSEPMSGRPLAKEGKNYGIVCNWLVDSYDQTREPHELVEIAVNAGFAKESLVKSLTGLDTL